MVDQQCIKWISIIDNPYIQSIMFQSLKFNNHVAHLIPLCLRAFFDMLSHSHSLHALGFQATVALCNLLSIDSENCELVRNGIFGSFSFVHSGSSSKNMMWPFKPVIFIRDGNREEAAQICHISTGSSSVICRMLFEEPRTHFAREYPHIQT